MNEGLAIAEGTPLQGALGGLTPTTLSVLPGGTWNRGARPYQLLECAREEGAVQALLGAGSQRSFPLGYGQELSARVQEERKGEFGGRLFHRVKKQAHYPTSPCGPSSRCPGPLTFPRPHKAQGIRRRAEDSKFRGRLRARPR